MKNPKMLYLFLSLSLTFFGACLGDEEVDTKDENVVEATPTPEPTPTPTPSLTDPPGIQAGVVISPDDPTVNRFFLTAPGTTPNAFDALIATGADVEYFDFGPGLGAFVCKIDGVGDCLGADPDHYWAFFTGDGTNGWTFSLVGVSQITIADGDRIAFTWTGSGPAPDYEPLRLPPPLSLEEIAAP